MFNLQESIANWRQQMAAAGIKSPTTLDELESHLREEMEKLAHSGILSEAEAFKIAKDRIGQSDLLAAEFSKISGWREERLLKLVGIGCGAFALLVSLWAAPHMLFAPQMSPTLRLSGWAAVTLTLFSVASWRFSYKYFPVISNRRTRLSIGMACSLVSVAGFYIFGRVLDSVIVPKIFYRNVGEGVKTVGGKIIGLNAAMFNETPRIFTLGVLILWAIALTAVLGAVAYGFEEAARRHHRKDSYV